MISSNHHKPVTMNECLLLATRGGSTKAERFNDSTFQRITSAKPFLAIRSMSVIGVVCHWNLAPPAATELSTVDHHCRYCVYRIAGSSLRGLFQTKTCSK